MTGRHPGANLAIAVMLCLCVGFAVGGAAAGSSSAESAADEPTAERALNKTAAEPGETVRVTATVTRDSAGPVDYLDEFEPAFADDASLVSLTANGDPISESLLGAFNDTIIVSAEGAPAGTVTVTYDVTVPMSATPGEVFSFDGLAQTGDGNDDETSVGGESTLVVGSATPTFEVALSSVPSSVTVGEELTVEATVTNTGDGEGTQQIGFAVDGEKQGNTAVTLDPGESKPVSFDYTTAETDTPAVDVAVSSANETATETVTVSTPASFEVALSSVPESVTAGAQFSGTATVTNAGGTTGTQSVAVTAGGEQVAGAQVTLTPGANGSLGFDYNVTNGDAPEFDVTVSSANETVAETVAVTERASFEVTLTGLPALVPVGEELTVEATVTNAGGTAGTQQVSFAVDGQERASTNVTLTPGANESLGFDYTVANGATSEFDVTVSSANETVSETVAVAERASFEVTLSSVPSSVPVGEELSGSVTVTNTGETAGTQQVTIAVDGAQVTGAQVTLEPGASKAITFEYTPTASDPGLNLTVSSANETATVTVAVTGTAFFGVTLSSVAESATAGDTVTGEAVVTNLGDTAGTQSVTVTVGGEPVTDTTVTLDAGATETVPFGYTVAATEVPQVAVTAASANDSATATVAVLDPPLFAVSVSAPGSVTSGAELSLTATVTNTGDVGATQTVSFGVDGVVQATRTVELAGGASETVTFGYTPAETGERNLTITTGEETASAGVRVLAPANFDVRLDSVPEAVEPGETTAVAVTVENTGGAGGTQSVVLSVGGDPVLNETLTLAGGEAVTLSYNHTAGTGDPSTLGVTAVTPNDTASATITVRTDSETPGGGNGDDTGPDTNATDDDTRTGTDDGSDEDGGASDGSGPGFGPGALVLAVLALVVLGLGPSRVVCAMPGLGQS